MEGVMDHTMRALLSNVGAMDYLVSEFVRVTQHAISTPALKKLVPELQQNCATSSGHPVHIQLLGSNIDTMTTTATNAISAGATHIDINFGCPAKRVNGHGGGAFLLQDPEALYNIVQSVRLSLPKHIPLSAKIRLGYHDESLFLENVSAIESGGADTLTIHGRTKHDGYTPPARWDKIALARKQSNMTIIANGDIYNLDTLHRCQTQTQCSHFMIGRGSLRNPFIFRELKGGHAGTQAELLTLVISYIETLLGHYDDFVTLGRIKQWCTHLRHNWPIIANNWSVIRKAQSTSELKQLLNQM